MASNFVNITKRKYILVLSDSRGKCLEVVWSENYQQKYPLIKLEVVTQPGATLQKLIETATEKYHQNFYDHIIVQGGICNLTVKLYNKGLYWLHYYRDTQVEDIIELIRNSKEQIKCMSFANIAPASLVKYFEINNGHGPENKLKLLQEQQANLLEDINTINHSIEEGNKISGHRTIDLDRHLVSKKRKRKGGASTRVSKFTDTHLTDGIHPDNYLMEKWHHRTCSSIITQLEFESATETSDSDLDSWNFKRRK